MSKKRNNNLPSKEVIIWYLIINTFFIVKFIKDDEELIEFLCIPLISLIAWVITIMIFVTLKSIAK